jgi:hypothetical protein
MRSGRLWWHGPFYFAKRLYAHWKQPRTGKLLLAQGLLVRFLQWRGQL